MAQTNSTEGDSLPPDASGDASHPFDGDGHPIDPQRYVDLFESHLAVMLLIDPADGRIVDANPAAARFYGYSRRRMAEMSIHDINVLPSEAVRREMRLAHVQQRAFFSFRHRLAGGDIRDVEVYSGPVRYAERSLLFSIIHDVSERKAMENHLRQTTQMHRALIQASPLAILTLAPDRTVLAWNPAAERIFGWREEEVIDRPLPLLFPDERDAADSLWERVLRGEELAGVERLRRRKDGALIEVSISTAPMRDGAGAIQAVMAIYQDISERVRAERERFDFLRDTLAGVTGGRLQVCRNRDELPAPLPSVGPAIPLSGLSLKQVRRAAERLAEELDFPEERRFDLVSAVGEAGMNAVVHAYRGEARLCADPARRLLQVWIEDRGEGIALEHLPRATLESGFTTAGSLGMGMPIMVRTVDRVWLLTGPSGTTVVLEKAAVPDSVGAIFPITIT